MNGLWTITMALALLGLAACSGESPTGPPLSAEAGFDDGSPPATITLQVVTSGAALDEDGYALSINGRTHAVPINLFRMAADLDAGTQTLWLSGVAPNCEVRNENPRQLSIEAGDRLKVSFEVVCFD